MIQAIRAEAKKSVSSDLDLQRQEKTQVWLHLFICRWKSVVGFIIVSFCSTNQRVAKKIKFASDSKTAVDAKMKASIKAYDVVTAAEELVKTQVTALRHKMNGDEDSGRK
mgnify:CR=1 FL=1